MDTGTAIAIGTATGNPGLGFALAYGDDTDYYTGDSPKLSFKEWLRENLFPLSLIFIIVALIAFCFIAAHYKL